MIEHNKETIEIVREYIAKAATRNNMQDEAVNFLPKKISLAKANQRIGMFLAIGMNSSGRTVTMQNALSFIQKGCNRFFLSLKNRKDLAEDLFKVNDYRGKYNLSCDYYVAPAVFDLEVIPDEVIEEWNKMIAPIVIKGRHGVKCIKVTLEGESIDNIKYNFVDRQA